MSLISRVASHNIGLIDWEPHMSMMYTRILRSFNLPVNYKKMKINKNLKLSTSATATWIMSTLVSTVKPQTWYKNTFYQSTVKSKQLLGMLLLF